MGVNLIVGYAGQETLAQAAFLGIGAYLDRAHDQGGRARSVSLSAPRACSTFIIGIVLGFPALRVQKHYLAFVTLAFSVLCWLVFRNEQWLTGGVMGIRDIERPSLFGLAACATTSASTGSCSAITAMLTFVLWWIVRSPWGRAFTALRENPMRAESLGVDVRLYTLLAFAIGSAYGGLAGALYAPLVEFIDPSPFALGPSLLFMLMVVIGGSGSFVGPFVGAGVAVLLPEWLRVCGGLLPPDLRRPGDGHDGLLPRSASSALARAACSPERRVLEDRALCSRSATSKSPSAACRPCAASPSTCTRARSWA